MFTRRDVFVESFRPQRLPGRDTQVDRLTEQLEPAADGGVPNSCWEVGPSGVGKTSTALHMLSDARYGFGINYTHIECLGQSRWEILSTAASDNPYVPQHESMGADELLEHVDEKIQNPYVVVFDEFDGLEVPEVLVDLDGLKLVSFICITHDSDQAFAMLPDEVDHLRHAEAVEFEPYSLPAMMEILEARVNEGLEPGVISRPQLERIADEAAGSARFGVQALRSAVELGIERGHTSVTDDDVEDCFEHAQGRIRKELLASLSRQHHIVYRIIREAGEAGITAEEIHEQYRERSENPRSRQTVLKYRKKLLEYDLVERETSGGRSSRWDLWRAVDEQLKAPQRDEEAHPSTG